MPGELLDCLALLLINKLQALDLAFQKAFLLRVRKTAVAFRRAEAIRRLAEATQLFGTAINLPKIPAVRLAASGAHYNRTGGLRLPLA